MFTHKMKEILNSGQLCCLGTIHGEDPYLSLMNFTFVEDEGILVMSSRSDSAKVRNILINPRVSVLVHEDEKLKNPVSMTMLGTVQLEEGERGEKYRTLHMQAHPDGSQFIQGQQIAILSFSCHRAILSDRMGRVSYWSL